MALKLCADDTSNKAATVKAWHQLNNSSVLCRQTECFKYLLQQQVDVVSFNKQLNRSAIHEAAAVDAPEIMRILLDDATQVETATGRTALRLARVQDSIGENK